MDERTDYRDTAGSFRLVVPAGWEVHEGSGGTLVTIAEPRSADGGFVANVNVLRYPNDRGLDEHAVIVESIEAMSVLLTDFVLLDQDEHDPGRLLFTFRQGIYGLTAEQRYALGDGVYFVVTGTVANGDYPEKRGMIAAAVDSFGRADSWTHSST